MLSSLQCFLYIYGHKKPNYTKDGFKKHLLLLLPIQINSTNALLTKTSLPSSKTLPVTETPQSPQAAFQCSISPLWKCFQGVLFKPTAYLIPPGLKEQISPFFEQALDIWKLAFQFHTCAKEPGDVCSNTERWRWKKIIVIAPLKSQLNLHQSVFLLTVTMCKLSMTQKMHCLLCELLDYNWSWTNPTHFTPSESVRSPNTSAALFWMLLSNIYKLQRYTLWGQAMKREAQLQPPPAFLLYASRWNKNLLSKVCKSWFYGLIMYKFIRC